VLSKGDCAIMGGAYTAAVTEEVVVKTCVNNNGKCCVKYNAGAKAARTALLVVLKTPYGIAVLIAALLNLILPVEKDDEEEEGEGKPAEAVTKQTESSTA